MNVKAPYLSLDEARAVIDREGCAWEGSKAQARAHREGWNIFNLGHDPAPMPTDAGIERYDDPEDWEGCADPIDFENDEAVIRHLQATAATDEDYATALKIEHALNSLRFHLWGEDWVDNRCGPE